MPEPNFWIVLIEKRFIIRGECIYVALPLVYKKPQHRTCESFSS